MKKKRVSFWQYISGNVLTNERFIHRLPILAFAGILALLYMGLSFRVQQKYSRINELTNQISRLRTISVTTSAVRMASSRQSEVEKLLIKYNIQLEYNTTPPKVIDGRSKSETAAKNQELDPK